MFFPAWYRGSPSERRHCELRCLALTANTWSYDMTDAVMPPRWKAFGESAASFITQVKGQGFMIVGKGLLVSHSSSRSWFIDWQYHTHTDTLSGGPTWRGAQPACCIMQNLILCSLFFFQWLAEYLVSNWAALPCWLKVYTRSECTTIMLNDSLDHFCSKAFR